MREEFEDPVRPPDKRLPILDFFVYKSFSYNHDTLQRARLFAGIVLTYTAVLVLAALYLALSTLPAQSKLIGCTLCLGIAALFIAQLSYLRLSAKLELCNQMIITSAYLAINIAIGISNGPTDSPVTQLLVIPPILAFCLIGLRSGIIWTALTFLGFFILVALEFSGFTFVQMIYEHHEAQTRFLVIMVGLTAVLGMITMYEVTTLRLRKERDIEHARYVYLANHDQLTHLANRTKFETVLKKTIRWHERRDPGPLVALVYLDLDGFKPINDQYGHHVGDAVLRIIALRLKSSLRSSDLVARQGGDEFTILLDQLANKEVIESIIIKLLEKIAQPIEMGGSVLIVTGSIGVSIYPEQTRNIEELKRFADAAMYQAKSGRNNWCIYQFESSSAELNSMSNGAG